MTIFFIPIEKNDDFFLTAAQRPSKRKVQGTHSCSLSHDKSKGIRTKVNFHT